MCEEDEKGGELRDGEGRNGERERGGVVGGRVRGRNGEREQEGRG